MSVILRKYGVETIIHFHLFEIDGIDLRIDAAHAAGDTKIMKDEGDEANTANGFVDEGQGYSLTLSAAEMTAARDVVYIVDQTNPKAWLDVAINIETYGNASAQHGFDLDAALTSPTKAEMDTAHALLATPAQVNTQVLDVLNTDTFAEPGQEAPTATTTLADKIGYLYKFLRNKITNDGTDIKVYNDAGAVVDQKSGVSEAAGTVTRAEFGSGP